MFICSRGLSKSWMCGVLAVAVANLYPRSEIVITSSTVGQANKMAEKILNEIIKRNSPVLLYMYEKEYWVKMQRDDGWIFENKLNGSTIRVLPALDSSRGSRATMLIYEEARLIKNSIIHSVFRPMAHPRQAQYLTNPKYGKDPRWLEETKTIYLSSTSYTFEWLYRQWKKCVVDMYNSPETKTNVFAGDIYTSIENGLKTIGDFNKAKRSSTEESFRMEDLNQFVGESVDAFFSLESLKKNQVLERCFTPPTPVDFIMGNQVDNRKKKEREIRMIVSDFAWTETKSRTNESDNSIAFCIAGIWRKDHFDCHIEYIEGLPTADDADGCANRLKELYWLYDADYLVPDGRSGGEAVLNSLSKPYTGAYGSYIPSSGLTVADESKYHVAPNDKLDYYRSHAVDSTAVHCVIPIFGTAALNTAYWRSMKRRLERGTVKLLIGMMDAQGQLEDSGDYFKMDSGQLANALAPYGQTDLLISEAVNLKTEIKNDQIKLEAPRGGHRDRAVTCAMGLLIFDYIENEWQRQDQQDDFDVENIQLVW
nr:MAG TPA_asm: large terminase [Caudoviricetes sp.]